MSSRRGWYRLGVVLSIAWAIGVSAVAAFEYFLAEPSGDLWFVAYAVKPNPNPFLEIWETPSVKVGALPITILIPVGLGWVAISLIVWAAGWVRAGFKS